MAQFKVCVKHCGKMSKKSHKKSKKKRKKVKKVKKQSAIDCEHSWACWTSEVFYTVITSDTYHFLAIFLPYESNVHCKIEIVSHHFSQ